MRRVARLRAWLMVLVGGAGAARAGEFQVNQFTTGHQRAPAVSQDAGGRFVAAWHSNGQDGSGYGVFGRRFSSSGNPVGPEFQINIFTTGYQGNAAASHHPSGGFVVAWESNDQDGADGGIFARRFDSSGSALGSEFLANVFTTNSQARPVVSHDAAGGFVIAWPSFGQDGSAWGIFWRRFDSSGNPLGGEFQANQHTNLDQNYATITHTASGGFVVAWQSKGQDGSFYGVFGRRFDSLGNALGGEFRVNQFTPNYQRRPTLAPEASGGFVVAWDSFGQDGNGYGIFGRRFDSSGNPTGAEFQINVRTSSTQSLPTIARDASGGFVVAWQSFGQDGNNYGAFGRRLDGSGAPLGAEFQINAFTTGAQRDPAISSDTSSAFVVTWQSLGQDGSYNGVFARRVPMPTVVATDDLVIEGPAGSSSAIFLVLLSEPPELGPLELDYATADATASAGSDYTGTSGMLSIPPGAVWGFVTVPVLGDTLYEADEAFGMNLSTTGLATLVDATAVGLIVNDEAPPSLLIGDLQITEGDSGLSTAQFTVSISEPSGLPARVDFSTFNGTAIAGEDYSTASGQLLFPAMSSAPQTALLLIHGDAQVEPDETLFVQLAEPVDAMLEDGLAVGTILNDDGNLLIAAGPAGGGASRLRRYQGEPR